MFGTDRVEPSRDEIVLGLDCPSVDFQKRPRRELRRAVNNLPVVLPRQIDVGG